MRKPFDGDFRISQVYGNDLVINGVHVYAQFGYKGHNGIDYALPTGTRVLAPHDGKIIESTLDVNGYGIYVKIENSVEGSVLAHFREARVGVGDGVKEGDLVGYSDNSGNSTGPHLHWGYYRMPRNRQNGYGGFIDQTPYLDANNNYSELQEKINELQTQLDQCRADRDRNWNWFVAVCDALKVPHEKDQAVNEVKKLLANEDALIQKDKQIHDLALKANDFETKLNASEAIREEYKQKNLELQQQIMETQKVLDAQSDTISNLIKVDAEEDEKYEQMKKELEELKEGIYKDTTWLDDIRSGIKKFLGIK